MKSFLGTIFDTQHTDQLWFSMVICVWGWLAPRLAWTFPAAVGSAGSLPVKTADWPWLFKQSKIEKKNSRVWSYFSELSLQAHVSGCLIVVCLCSDWWWLIIPVSGLQRESNVRHRRIKPHPGKVALWATVACSKRAPFPCLCFPSGCCFIPPFLHSLVSFLSKEQTFKHGSVVLKVKQLS